MMNLGGDRPTIGARQPHAPCATAWNDWPFSRSAGIIDSRCANRRTSAGCPGNSWACDALRRDGRDRTVRHLRRDRPGRAAGLFRGRRHGDLAGGRPVGGLVRPARADQSLAGLCAHGRDRPAGGDPEHGRGHHRPLLARPADPLAGLPRDLPRQCLPDGGDLRPDRPRASSSACAPGPMPSGRGSPSCRRPDLGPAPTSSAASRRRSAATCWRWRWRTTTSASTRPSAAT